MTSLDRVTGITSDLAAFLGAVGVLNAEELADADAEQLHRDLEALGRKRGRASLVPGLITVKLWIQSAKELALANPVAMASAAPSEQELVQELEADGIPEAISIMDIPEAIVDETAPDYYAKRAAKQSASAPSPTPAPTPSPVSASEPAVGDVWKSLDKSRFQTLDAYAKSERGIEPLRRKSSPVTDSGDKIQMNHSGKVSRLTRRGVLYPNPWRAIFGAMVSLIWRLALVVTCIGLPIYLYFNSTPESRPVLETSLWLGGFLFLSLLQLWVMERTRCRICSCHFFFSKRCAKNSKAHRLSFFGYVASLSLHLLLFQWFRCMYCGTAIRLFPGRQKVLAIVEPIEEDETLPTQEAR
jgi:hypothetical protein